MISNINPEQYSSILNISKYKILIFNEIKWYIDNDKQNRYIDINELYNCYKILFNADKLFPKYSYNITTNNMDFTIHHFIYYIVSMQSKAFKMTTSINDKYDILELYNLNIIKAYQEHLNKIIYKLYDYLYPIGDINMLPNIFISLKNIFDYESNNTFISKQNNSYFTRWDEYDLLYTLNYYIVTAPDENDEYYNEDFIGPIMYYSVIHDISNHKYSLNDFTNIIDNYTKKRNIERLKLYEEELIVKTWHPERLINWCLDTDDKTDIGII